jgi:hypothetical protein
LGAYGNIATAYPDYEMQESLFKNNPFEQRRSKRPDCKTNLIPLKYAKFLDTSQERI